MHLCMCCVWICAYMCLWVCVAVQRPTEASEGHPVSLFSLISLRQCFSLTLILAGPARLSGLRICLGSSWDQPLATVPLMLRYGCACQILLLRAEGSKCSCHTCIGILLPTKLSLQHPLLQFKMTG